jgi:hypothetical protein
MGVFIKTVWVLIESQQFSAGDIYGIYLRAYFREKRVIPPYINGLII